MKNKIFDTFIQSHTLTRTDLSTMRSFIGFKGKTREEVKEFFKKKIKNMDEEIERMKQFKEKTLNAIKFLETATDEQIKELTKK